MRTFKHKKRQYAVEADGFLADFGAWRRDFAEGMAGKIGIKGGLSEAHWRVIGFIRDRFKETGRCPLVYETCRANGLSVGELKRLFPSGYLRGACKLAGITYREGYLDQAAVEELAERIVDAPDGKEYRVNVRGFLLHPEDWDEQFAMYKAAEMKLGRLTPRHWQLIRYLRESFAHNGVVPTVYEACEASGIDLDELQRLFPDGYHRGAVKLAGLRVR